jgi:hypothetical protein
MEEKGIIGSVLVEQSEDETVIIKLLEYMQATDTIVGSCGRRGADHECQPDYVHVVGHDQGSYARLQDFFRHSIVAHMARVVMINPLHTDLPAYCVLLMPTCNTFRHHFVVRQWERIEELHRRYLLPVLGPLTGKASDGDSRRRKAMEMHAYSDQGNRFSIDHANFTASGEIKADQLGRVYSLGIMDQDYIHCGKKLTYPLDHATRLLNLGGHMVHMNHLELVHQTFPIRQHGLRNEDINRQDRQNWESAQRIFFPMVRECLYLLEVGGQHGVPQDVKGNRIYLEIGC